MLKAVIFDMDGTLLDSEIVHYYAICGCLKERVGYELTMEEYLLNCGIPDDQMWPRILKDLSSREGSQLWGRFEDDYKVREETQFLKKREFSYDNAVDGMRQILWGLFKKIVVADNCAVYVDQVFSTYTGQSGSTLLLAAIFFTFQIYGDFSGYSDIAIGTAKLFGIKLMRNFNVPYFSRDIAEFWRRWHISLTTWFRDYVYIPLGGSRVSKAKVVRNTFIIFLVSGFWHGANWTFIAWGAYHAILFLPLILTGKNRKYTNQVAEGRWLPSLKEVGQMLLTFFLAVIGWIIFRAETIGQAWGFICGIFDRSLLSLPWIDSMTYMLPMPFILLLFVLMEWIQREKQHGLEIQNTKKRKWLRIFFYYVLCALIIQYFGAEQTFIYFQF